ncbi:MAG: pyridoxamine 5'-phosphate oxidase family protein [Planctomycetota bacterium]
MATLRQKVSKLIGGAKACTLVTVNAKGEPRCRLMGNLAKGVAKTFHLITYVKSNKMTEIAGNPRVDLFYVGGESSYTCVVGRARVRVDKATKARLWKREWLRYFPGGKADPNYGVIEVRASRIEHFDNKIGKLQVFKP